MNTILSKENNNQNEINPRPNRTRNSRTQNKEAMKCHYWKDKDGERHLIPGCLAVVHSGEKQDCTCPSGRKTDSQRIIDLEIKVKELTNQIKAINACSNLSS